LSEGMQPDNAAQGTAAADSNKTINLNLLQ
jgi:hypothetical protein